MQLLYDAPDSYGEMETRNGIIENSRELKLELEGQGYAFKSDTDTEAAALLIDDCTKDGDRLSGILAYRHGN